MLRKLILSEVVIEEIGTSDGRTKRLSLAGAGPTAGRADPPVRARPGRRSARSAHSHATRDGRRGPAGLCRSPVGRRQPSCGRAATDPNRDRIRAGPDRRRNDPPRLILCTGRRFRSAVRGDGRQRPCRIQRSPRPALQRGLAGDAVRTDRGHGCDRRRGSRARHRPSALVHRRRGDPRPRRGAGSSGCGAAVSDQGGFPEISCGHSMAWMRRAISTRLPAFGSRRRDRAASGVPR